MEKNSYELCVYESVDDRSLSYVSKIDEKNNSGHKGLNKRYKLKCVCIYIYWS